MWPSKSSSALPSGMLLTWVWLALMICAPILCNVEADAIVAKNQTAPVQRRHRQSKETQFARTEEPLGLADEPRDEEAADDDGGQTPWTSLLEDWVVSNPTQSAAQERASRQMYTTMSRYAQPPPLPLGPKQHQHHPQPHGPRQNFYINRRMGEAAPPAIVQQQPPTPSAKQNIFRPNRPLPPALNFEQIRQTSSDISETDLYLLSAIEKLVHRVDYLEKRLQTTDKLILHLLNDVKKDTTCCVQATAASVEQPLLKPVSRPTTASTFGPSSSSSSSTPQMATQQSASTAISSAATTAGLPATTTTITKTTTASPPTTLAAVPTKPAKPTKPSTKPPTLCPRDFTAIRKVCYHINRNAHADWKTANTRCRALGSHLAEFANAREFKAVSEYLGTNAANGLQFASNGSFWLGGLNPGLLWIWSSSARPVNPASNLAAFGSQPANGSTTVIPAKQRAEASADGQPQKALNVFDIQGNGRCLNLQYNATLGGFEYFGEDCSRAAGYVCEMRNRNVENEIKRVFRALHLE